MQSGTVPALHSYRSSQGFVQPEGMMVTYLPEHVGLMVTQQEFFQVSIDSQILVYDEPDFSRSENQKQRLHWSPELHARFVEAVNKLGGASKATPKAIQNVMGTDGLTLHHIKSHLQKFRLGKPVGRLWKKLNRPQGASRKTTDLEIQLSPHGSGSSKSPMTSGVYIHGEGLEGQIHYETNQLQSKPDREKPFENNQGGQHHSENVSYTPAGLKTHDKVPVAALLQPKSAARNEFGDYQTQLPTELAVKVQVGCDEEETDALPPIPRSSLEDYLKAFGQSTNLLRENFPGFGGDATLIGNPWDFGATYLD